MMNLSFINFQFKKFQEHEQEEAKKLMLKKKNAKEDFPKLLEEVDRKAHREVAQSNFRFLKKKFEMKRESTLLNPDSKNSSPLAKIK